MGSFLILQSGLQPNLISLILYVLILYYTIILFKADAERQIFVKLYRGGGRYYLK